MNTHVTQRFSWTKGFIVAVCAGLFAVWGSIYAQTHGVNLGALVPIHQTAGAGTSFEVPATPVRLVIPAIGVDANVQKVGLAWQGTGDMGIPTNFTDVGWYKDGVLPGEPGSAVIDGHLDGHDVKEAVFYNLDKLKKGDTVEVMDAKGKTLTFRVVDTKVYGENDNASDVFQSNDTKAHLNLITCSGDWIPSEKSYDKRIVVFTELVKSS